MNLKSVKCGLGGHIGIYCVGVFKLEILVAFCTCLLKSFKEDTHFFQNLHKSYDFARRDYKILQEMEND